MPPTVDDEADLYGDLYGADDADYTQDATEEYQVPLQTETEPTKKAPTSTSPNIDNSTPFRKDITDQEAFPTKKDEEPPKQPLPNPPVSYSPQVAQQSFASAAPLQQEQRIERHELPANPIPSLDRDTPPTVLGGSGDRSVRPSEMKDEGKMFVGGLNWDTTDEGLRHYFSEFGKVDACTIMRDPTGRSRGFAFLTFEDPAAVNAVMVREHYLDGKIIDPKRAIPRQEHHRTQKLFVGGLAPSVTTESMREYFSQFGRVMDATVMVDRDSSRSKGFGFVTFEEASAAERLLGLPGLEIDGKLIDVKLAQPRAGGQNRESHSGGYNNREYDNRNGPSTSNFNANGPGGGSSSTPFDPQALAQLYQRMSQMGQWPGGQTGGMMGMNPMMGMGGPGMGGMGMYNPMMNMGGGMNPMMGMGGMAMGRGGGMPGGPMGSTPGMGPMGGMGIPTGPSGMGRGGPAGGPNIPRGPRAGPMGPNQNIPTGPGPQRFPNRGQHNFRPY